MKIHHIAEQNSILHHFLTEIRDSNFQNDRMRFRRNIERIGEILAYEISKSFQYMPVDVPTPLGVKHTAAFEDEVVLCSILRAGLPLHRGFLNYYDHAENGFISAYRHHYNHDDLFTIKVEYQAIPSLDNKTVLLIDPMLATGQSIVAVYEQIVSKFAIKDLHIAVVIAAPEGIELLNQHLPDSVHLWVASVDEGLNDKKYIVPGLGDAGDLAYGSKL